VLSVKVKSKPLGLENLGDGWWEEWLDHPLRKEMRRVRSNRKKAFVNYLVLDELNRLPNKKTSLKTTLREILQENGIPLDVVNDKSLSVWYDQISKDLDRRYGLTEAFRTRFERRFYYVFRGISKHKIKCLSP